jgi:hypothetical protein
MRAAAVAAEADGAEAVTVGRSAGIVAGWSMMLAPGGADGSDVVGRSQLDRVTNAAIAIEKGHFIGRSSFE